MTISVVTACRNAAPSLGAALDSVLGQSWPALESVVVDGASMDGTLAVIQAHAATSGGRLHWISEPDAGLYDAINKGLRMSTGDIVALLHADDTYTSSDVLEQVARCFERTGADVVHADVKFVAADDTSRTVRVISSQRFRPWMMRYGFMPPHPAIFCRRELFDRLGYYRTDYRISADHELMVRFLWNAGLKRAYLPLTVVAMRTGGISTRSARSRWIACRENVRACRENGRFANMAMQLVKYAFKVFEYRWPIGRSDGPTVGR